MRRKNLDFITSLRGLAALYVVLYHLAAETKIFGPKWLSPFIGAGGSGVMLFFIVSAFTLCLSMESRSESETTPTLNYFLRRFFRIAPLFYIWMLIYFFRDMLVFHVTQPISVLAASASFTLNLIPGMEQGFVWASWTIGVEMIFYVFFPVIFNNIKNIGTSLALLIVSLVFRSAWHSYVAKWIADPALSNQYYYTSFLYHLPTFIFGIVAYHAYKLLRKNLNATINNGIGYLMVASCCGGFVWMCYGGVPLDQTQAITIQMFLYGLLLLGLSINSVTVLVNRLTRFYGEVSYSVYLCHATILYFMESVFTSIYAMADHKGVAYALCIISAFSVITPLSWLTYRYIEKPGNALGRRIIHRLQVVSG